MHLISPLARSQGLPCAGTPVIEQSMCHRPPVVRGTRLAAARNRSEESAMDLIVTLIVGGIVGWLASIVMRTNAQMGILANVLVGIVGSYLGRFLADAAGVTARGGAAGWLVSIVGAVLLIAVLRALGVFGRPALR